MPRGRAGLCMIPPDEVRRVVHFHKPLSRYGAGRNVRTAARRLEVNERTIRRALIRGLPLLYGRNWISREQWETFAAETRPPTSASTRRPSPVRRDRPDKCRSLPVRRGPPPARRGSC